MNFKNPTGQLARWLEELGQYNMKIQHRSGNKHANADGLSRVPDVSRCDYYRAGVVPDNLPCGGCKYCKRAHENWSQFREDVDYAVPLGKTFTSSETKSVQCNMVVNTEGSNESISVGTSKQISSVKLPALCGYNSNENKEAQKN